MKLSHKVVIAGAHKDLNTLKEDKKGETREEMTCFGNSQETSKEDELVIRKREKFLHTTQFNGRLINVLIDTGANECLIRKDLVTDISKITPSPSTAKLFDGSEVNLLGCVSENFSYRGETVMMPFYIVAELSNPIILGANWIRRSGAILTQKMCTGIYSFKVDGIDGLLECLIDSGAEICLVRRDVLTDSIKSKIKPLTDNKARLPNGSRMDLLGYVYLCVTYLGKTVTLLFFVVAESFTLPMILGTTWIRKSGAILQSDGRQLGVTFGGKEEIKGCRTDYCSSPRVSVDVDGIDGLVTALVDTGASGCAVRRDQLTDDQMSKVISTTSTSITANGAQREALGLVSFDVTFQGITTRIENVKIVSKSNHQLVLGMDWIDQTRAVIQSDGSEIIVSQPDSTPEKEGKSAL